MYVCMYVYFFANLCLQISFFVNPAPFFANLFLAHKEADWIKAQRKLGTTNVRKINNSFQFIDDLISLNDGITFEKHYKDIYPTEFELEGCVRYFL